MPLSPPEDLALASKLALWLAAGLPVALAMETWSRVLHGRVWHGPLYGIHASHHPPAGAPRGRFEANDALSVTHAPIAIAAILYGCVGPFGALREALFGLGLGMTLFGLAYIVVHDGLIHGRLPVGFLMRWRFFRRVRAAHEVHHERGAEPYGLFRGPAELKALRDRRASATYRTSTIEKSSTHRSTPGSGPST